MVTFSNLWTSGFGSRIHYKLQPNFRCDTIQTKAQLQPAGDPAQPPIVHSSRNDPQHSQRPLEARLSEKELGGLGGLNLPPFRNPHHFRRPLAHQSAGWPRQIRWHRRQRPARRWCRGASPSDRYAAQSRRVRVVGRRHLRRERGQVGRGRRQGWRLLGPLQSALLLQRLRRWEVGGVEAPAADAWGRRVRGLARVFE